MPQSRVLPPEHNRSRASGDGGTPWVLRRQSRNFSTNGACPTTSSTHDKTLCSSATAHASSISEDNVAKGVLIRRKDGFLMAIVPASSHIELEKLGAWLNQPVGLATEEEIALDLRGLRARRRAARRSRLRIEGRDGREPRRLQRHLLRGWRPSHVRPPVGPTFHRLMANVPHARFSARGP